MDSSWQRFTVIATVAVIALLIMSNALLLTLVLRDDEAGDAKPASAQTSLPQLPASSSGSGGSSKALLKELDKTKSELKDPLTRALTDLSNVTNSTASLGDLPVLLQQMVAYSAAFQEVAPKLQSIDKHMRSLNKNINSMTAFVNGTGAVLVDLERAMQAMQNDIAKIRECTEKPDSCK